MSVKAIPLNTFLEYDVEYLLLNLIKSTFMKKNLCILLVSVLCISSAYSQVIQRGDKLFGGSFSATFFNINGNGPNYNSSGNAGIFPSFAWAIKNDLVLGVKGGISYSSSTNKLDPN